MVGRGMNLNERILDAVAVGACFGGVLGLIEILMREIAGTI